MIKVVYNACYGGYSVSDQGLAFLNQKRQGKGLAPLNNLRLPYYCARHDPLLVQVVEELGENANGKYANLKIAEIPIEYQDCYEITEYDGLETVKCNPSDIILHTLKKICDVDGGVAALSDQECRIALQSLEKIVKESE